MSIPSKLPNHGVARLVQALVDLGVGPSDRILDLGAFRDPLLWGLHSAGFRNLYGVDDHRTIYDDPFNTRIRYFFGDPADSHLPPGFFRAVFRYERTGAAGLKSVVREVCRLLTPGGAFVVFGLPKGSKLGTLSDDPIRAMAVDTSAGLERVGLLEAASQPSVAGVSGTGMARSDGSSNDVGPPLTFVRDRSPSEAPLPPAVSILSYSAGAGGIREYAVHLSRRLGEEEHIRTELTDDAHSASFATVLIEYAKDLPRARTLCDDVAGLTARGHSVLVEIHDDLSRLGREDRKVLENTATLLYRTNEAAQADAVRRYQIMSIIAYSDVPAGTIPAPVASRLGWFGYAAVGKYLDRIVRFALRLGVPALLLASENRETPGGPATYRKVMADLQSFPGVTIRTRESTPVDLPVDGASPIQVIQGYFPPEEIVARLSTCSHLVFAHTNTPNASGTMTLGKRVRRPILATDSFQSRLGQAIRFGRLNPGEWVAPVVDRAVDLKLTLHDLRYPGRRTWAVRALLSEFALPTLSRLARDPGPTKPDLAASVGEIPQEDDGLPYLARALRFASSPRASLAPSASPSTTHL